MEKNIIVTEYDLTFVDINGKPIPRTPHTHPYNYDEYLIWKSACDIKNSHRVYSDRLFQWNPKTYNKCCQEIFQNTKQDFSRRNPKDIERFLSMYFEKEIKLTAITCGCNQSSGYPYWVFFYDEY